MQRHSRHTYRVNDISISRKIADTIVSAHGFEISWPGNKCFANRGRRLSRAHPLESLVLSFMDYGGGLCMIVEIDSRHELTDLVNDLFRALKAANQCRITTRLFRWP